MASRMPQLNSRDCIRAFEKLGFIVRWQSGSHVILRHPMTKCIISLPMHPGDVKRGLLFGLLKQSRVSRENFLAAL